MGWKQTMQIGYPSLGDVVYEYLSKQIIEGHIRYGEKLNHCCPTVEDMKPFNYMNNKHLKIISAFIDLK